jgi:GNAT superfamily N-acetyltransferase
VRVVGFVDQYDEIVSLHGRAAEELRAQDEARREPVQRWVAHDGVLTVATATALLRPDRRRFLTFTGELEALGPLVRTAAEQLGEDLFASTSMEQPGLLMALQKAGFDTEVASEAFQVRFDAALAGLRRARLPDGFSVVPVQAVDTDQLFALDNTIRSGIRGMEGWQGNWDWFCDELTDPAAYLVAVDESNAEYAGLARVWRNEAGARFGLIGVTPRYRGTMLGPGLLRRTLEESSAWGHPTFTAETGVENKNIHHRLRRIAAMSLGVRLQMVRRS